MGAYENYLAHHGVKGQKWGVRRYQNADGSLTAEGKARLNQIPIGARQNYRQYNSMIDGIKVTNEKLKQKYQKNPSERLRKAIATNEKDIAEMSKVRDEILTKDYSDDRYDAGKAIGYGLLAGGSAGVTAAAVANTFMGGALMNVPIAIAAGSATVEFGREYLRQIGMRKEERGGAT